MSRPAFSACMPGYKDFASSPVIGARCKSSGFSVYQFTFNPRLRRCHAVTQRRNRQFLRVRVSTSATSRPRSQPSIINGSICIFKPTLQLFNGSHAPSPPVLSPQGAARPLWSSFHDVPSTSAAHRIIAAFDGDICDIQAPGIAGVITIMDRKKSGR